MAAIKTDKLFCGAAEIHPRREDGDAEQADNAKILQQDNEGDQESRKLYLLEVNDSNNCFHLINHHKFYLSSFFL